MKKVWQWLLNKYHSLNMRPEVKNGLIIGFLGVVSAVIIAFATFFSGGKPSQTTTAGNSGSIAITGSARDVTINYQASGDNLAKEAIQELDRKILETDDKVEVTRKELALVTKALKDLDQRTSGIQKLPDGRTLFAKMISGDPNVVIDEHNVAIQASNAGNLAESLKHSQAAIEAYEQAKQKIVEARAGISMGGGLDSENAGKLYWLAAITAQQMQKNNIANEYAEKMVQINPSPLNKALLATTLFNLGRREEALKVIQEAIDSEPNNTKILEVKNKILQRK